MEAAAAEAEAMEADEEENEKAGNSKNEESHAGDKSMSVRSEESIKDDVTEAELLFIMYARDVFKTYDKDESNHVSPNEARGCFTFFDVYMSMDQVVKVIAMFLRDSGNPSQLDE